jgi:hypothetical protein
MATITKTRLREDMPPTGPRKPIAVGLLIWSYDALNVAPSERQFTLSVRDTQADPDAAIHFSLNLDTDEAIRLRDALDGAIQGYANRLVSASHVGDEQPKTGKSCGSGDKNLCFKVVSGCPDHPETGR